MHSRTCLWLTVPLLILAYPASNALECVVSGNSRSGWRAEKRA